MKINSVNSNSGNSLQRSEVAKLVTNFMEATREVIQTTGQTKTIARTKAATVTDSATISGDAAGALSFEGDYGGQFIIAYTKEAICEITTNMLFSETPYKNHHDPDVEGAIGEMTNQIAGRARMKINEQTGWKAINGIPSVIVGENIRWNLYGGDSLIVHVPFTTPDTNELYLEVAISHHPMIGEMAI